MPHPHRKHLLTSVQMAHFVATGALRMDAVVPDDRNQQAIGAHVVVTTKFGKQAGWVGQSEGSRHSSGLYDIYFGLGLVQKVTTVEVFWPTRVVGAIWPPVMP